MTIYQVTLSKFASGQPKPPVKLMSYDMASNWINRQAVGNKIYYNIIKWSK